MPTPVVREDQPRTNTWTCGTQPAHQSLFTYVQATSPPIGTSVMREPTEKSASAKSMRNEVLQKDIRALFSGHIFEVLRSGIGPRQQVINLAVGVTVDDPGDDVGEVGMRFYADEFTSLDQRGDDGPVLAATV